jgi:spore coat protein CotF
MTPNGSLFPFPEITGSLPAPTGFEFVDTLISASNDVISMDDTNKSLYKRIYHNIPYLLKSKGTLTGLRALITSYGIPDTILKISEFGGKDKVNANDWDLYFNNFNYSFKSVEPNFIQTPWAVTNTWGATNSKPSTVQLRFKSEKFPPTNLSQSLWEINESGVTAELLLDYNGSGSVSGSYGGSIQDPNYQYANLRFIPYSDEPEVSASISLPFYNGDWWSVMITTDQSDNINLYAGNKIYNGNDGTSLGYYASASVEGATLDVWVDGSTSTFVSSSLLYPSYKYFSGSLQEIRYYNQQISESVFKDFIMNPLSFEGNGVNSAPDQLIFRAALGSELDITTTSSIHPKVTGSYNITQSFTSNSNWTINSLQGLQYAKNTEYFFLDQPAVGIKNRITDKIRSESDTLPSGSVLSPIRKLSQTTEASASYTDNINYLEVAFSPQNQINDDIIGQLGHFNIGDYIGDPRQRSSSLQVYPDLENLSEEYFKKYIKQYDLVDFVRLIKFFDYLK